jgi:hypothetical protein
MKNMKNIMKAGALASIFLAGIALKGCVDTGLEKIQHLTGIHPFATNTYYTLNSTYHIPPSPLENNLAEHTQDITDNEQQQRAYRNADGLYTTLQKQGFSYEKRCNIFRAVDALDGRPGEISETLLIGVRMEYEQNTRYFKEMLKKPAFRNLAQQAIVTKEYYLQAALGEHLDVMEVIQAYLKKPY